jgi:hypothetical protein
MHTGMISNRDSQLLTDTDRRILEAVRGLEYGSVEIVVHDSQVVQIERREKVRLEKVHPEKVHPDDPGRPRPGHSGRP